MGAIQNAINSAASAAAKVTTAIAGIDALKSSEKAKGLQEKIDIQKDVAEDLNDLNAITTEADKAAKAQVTAEQNLKNSEDAYKRGMYFGTNTEAAAEWDLNMRSEIEDAQATLKRANQYAEMAKQARQEQITLLNQRKEVIKARVEAYNKTARRRGVSKIKMEELYKGGKK